MTTIKVTLYYHLKEKAGTGFVEVDLDDTATIKDLKKLLEQKYPTLRTHLDNVMILMDKQIVIDEDYIKDNSNVSFLTPIGGG